MISEKKLDALVDDSLKTLRALSEDLNHTTADLVVLRDVAWKYADAEQRASREPNSSLYALDLEMARDSLIQVLKDLANY